MTKPKRREIADAVDSVAGPRANPLAEALGQAHHGSDRMRHGNGGVRRRREGRQGLLIYIRPDVHHELKRLALEQHTTMQALCAMAIEKMTKRGRA